MGKCINMITSNIKILMISYSFTASVCNIYYMLIRKSSSEIAFLPIATKLKT